MCCAGATAADEVYVSVICKMNNEKHTRAKGYKSDFRLWTWSWRLTVDGAFALQLKKKLETFYVGSANLPAEKATENRRAV